MELNIEEIVNKQIVAEVLAKIPEDKRNAMFEQSLTKVLNDVFHTWEVEKAIKADAEQYMAEYIRTPEVQDRIRAGVVLAFDRILEGMVDTFEKKIDDTISSEYVSFRKKRE